MQLDNKFDSKKLDLEKQQLELEVQQAHYDFIQFFKTMPRWWAILSATAIILIIPGFFIAKYSTSYFYYKTLSKTAALVHSAEVSNLPVKVESTAALQISGNNYAAYAQIKNQNGGLTSPSIAYTFHFLDANGKEIGTATGTDFLLAGEEKYIVAPRTQLPSAPAQITVDVVPSAWQARTQLPSVVLVSTTPTFSASSNGNNGLTIYGTVLNKSVYTLGSVQINGFAYNSSGKIIAITQTVADTIMSNENRAYQLFWPVDVTSQVASVKVFPETNILDSSNVQ
jgi:hypothetical protein